MVPSRMVSVSASVNLPLLDKVQKFFLAPAHLGGPGKRAVKRLWWFVSLLVYNRKVAYFTKIVFDYIFLLFVVVCIVFNIFAVHQQNEL